MPQEYAISDGQSGCLGITLRCIWNVDKDSTYQVRPQRQTETALVAIRTLQGRGSVEIAEHGRFDLQEETLLFTEVARLRHYGAAGARWRFVWFQFARDGGMNVPWHERLTAPQTAWETETTAQAFALLALPDPASRAAASARFGALLYDWASRWQRSGAAHDPQRTMVYHAIARMQQDLSRPISVAALAAEYGISARWFRQIFRHVMGVSPKQYDTHYRLDQAAGALRMGVGTVTQLAEQLGYASPFHFSRAFKARYGCSPSHYLQK